MSILSLGSSRARAFTLINFIIGALIAVVLSMLLALGLRIFVPAPEYPSYSSTYDKCLNSDSACIQRAEEESRRQQETYTERRKEYGGKIFIAGNIFGLILLIAGIILFTAGLGTNIGAGVILAGGFGITYGYTLGWEGADDATKFIFGVIIAIFVIAGGVVVNRMKSRAVSELPSITPTGV